MNSILIFRNSLKASLLLFVHVFCSAVYAQLPPPYEGLSPDSPFGMDMRAGIEGNIAIAKDLGLKWTRGLGNEWFNQWDGDTAAVRTQIKQFQRGGLMPLIVLFYPLGEFKAGPSALGLPSKERIDPSSTYTYYDRYLDKVYRLVEATHDLVPYYEHWNEPWVDEWAWHDGTAEEYRQMTRDIWDKVKADFPEVQLIGGGSVAYNRDNLYPKGLTPGYVDGTVNHAYAYPGPGVYGSVLTQFELDKTYAQNDGEAGAWQTEFGTYLDMFPESSNQQEWVGKTLVPSYLLHMLAAHHADRPIRLFWFNWSGHGGHDIDDNEYAKSAYRTMTRMVEGTKIHGGAFPASKAMWGVVFANDYSEDSRTRAALFVNAPYLGDIGNPWEPGGGRGDGDLPSDAYAGTLSIADRSGMQAFTYRGEPIENLNSITLNPSEVVWLIADMSPDEMMTELQNAQFDLKTQIKVTPLSLSGVPMKGRTLDFKVENVVNKTLDGTLEISAPGGWTLNESEQVIASLEPGEQRVISFVIDEYQLAINNTYDLSYTVRVDGSQHVLTNEWTIQTASAPKATFEIDGDISDWATVVATTMGKGDYQFKLAWDDSYLYFAAKVADSTHDPFPPFEESMAWFMDNRIDGALDDGERDGLYIAIDCIEQNPDDLLYGHPYYEKAAAADVDYEFFATYCAGEKSELWRYRAPGSNHQGYYPTSVKGLPISLGKMDASADGGKEGRVSYSREGNVTTYEGAINWSAIPELKVQLSELEPGAYHFPHVAWRVKGGNAGTQIWTIASGQLEEGVAGFVPTWKSGQLQNGGRVISRWSFVNGDGRSLPERP